MKGVVMVRDFMIFLSELAVLLLSMYFLLTAGAAMGDLIFNFNARIASETIFGFEAAADMAGNNFEASFAMPSNPYKISIGKDGGSNFILISSTREKFTVSEGGTIKEGGATLKIQQPEKLYFISTTGNGIRPLNSEVSAPAGGKMSESTGWLITVKKTGNDVNVFASPNG